VEPLTKKEVAYILDAHPKTVETWERQHGLPVEVVGGTGPGRGTRYDGKDAVRWYVAREVEKQISQLIKIGDYDKDDELGRLRYHQANIADMEEQRIRKESLDASEVAAAWVDIVMQARSTLLALPVRLAQVAFSGASMREIEAAAREEIEGALNEMADRAVYTPDPEELETEDSHS